MEKSNWQPLKMGTSFFSQRGNSSYVLTEHPDKTLTFGHLSMKHDPSRQLLPWYSTPGTLPHLDGQMRSAAATFMPQRHRGHSLLLCLHTPFIVWLAQWRPESVCACISSREAIDFQCLGLTRSQSIGLWPLVQIMRGWAGGGRTWEAAVFPPPPTKQYFFPIILSPFVMPKWDIYTFVMV